MLEAPAPIATLQLTLDSTCIGVGHCLRPPVAPYMGSDMDATYMRIDRVYPVAA